MTIKTAAIMAAVFFSLHADRVYGTIYIDLQDNSKGKMKNITGRKISVI